MSKRLLSLACCLMVAILPLNGIAADAVGMLNSTGAVLIDNRQATRAEAVFAGEVIQTKANSKAIVAGRGKTVSVGENSSVRLGSQDLELQAGAVVVASTGYVLRVDTVTVTASPDAPSKFIARKINGNLQVLTLEGSVSVSDGQQTTQVPATRGVNVGSPGKHISWLLNDDIGILIVVAAAITAGVTLGIVNAQNAKKVSPSAP